MHEVSARAGTDPGGLRRGEPDRGRPVHRRSARVPRGQAGRAVRGRRRPAAHQGARRRARSRTSGRLHLQHLEMPASGEPRPSGGRDRIVHPVVDRAGLADPTSRHRHARQLRHEVRPADTTGDHAHARPRLRLARQDRDPDVPSRGDPPRRRGEVASVRRAPRGLRARARHPGGADQACARRGACACEGACAAKEPAPSVESAPPPAPASPTIEEPVRVPDAEDERAPEEQLELF